MSSEVKAARQIYRDVEKLYRLYGLYNRSQEHLEQHVKIVEANFKQNFSSGEIAGDWLHFHFLMSGVMYEGAPGYPNVDRWWEIVERYGVTVLYTAPTAIRGFMRQGESWPDKHPMSSLRLLGSVGEPINPEAWRWYHKHIGKERCPIMDTWWQTETGGFMMAHFPSGL